ncbi:PA14 domain-containing protein [Cavenderia fasciculata]|uniref:PA14 domain-containing protein n=1 Tax=Cavenderia fasciculata TaxID=261658 RepID=F4Q9M9_CACFS|nr:PA14 domain-containing protein [Cavenderia fasciculata]EGG15398.1 PA14 domain-containing protein [Cavenderia fasciculata]|eukprot:XP_004354140.1 PA14 domain-containing protein [Cavenderia fasciculata]
MKTITIILVIIVYFCCSILVFAQDLRRLPSLIRDQTPERNPDFEIDNPNRVITGIVKKELGKDSKPVYCCGNDSYPSRLNGYVVHNQSTFNSWFNNVPGVNIPIPFTLTLTKNSTDPLMDTYTFNNDAFFPIEGKGWEAPGADPMIRKRKYLHNFHFCMETHAFFTFSGIANQFINVRGDDDLWLFINKQLVVDLGSPHSYLIGGSRSLVLDKLGLVKDMVYAFDLFFCERHSMESHLQLSTSLSLFPNPRFLDFNGEATLNLTSFFLPHQLDAADFQILVQPLNLTF